MPVPEHDDDDALWGEFAELASRIRSRLQDGGPPVDEDQLFDLISGDLSESESRATSELIRTWRTWHEYYWRMRAYLDLVDDDEPNGEKISDVSSQPVVEVEDRKATGVEPPDAMKLNPDMGSRPQSDFASPDSRAGKLVPRSTPLRQRGLVPIVAAAVLMLICGLSIHFMTRPTSVAQIRDGQQLIAIDSSGKVSGLPDIEDELRTSVVKVIGGQKLMPLAALPFMPGTRSGNNPPLSQSLLLQPYNTVVSSERPTFRWEVIDDAITYSIRVYDAENQKLVTGQPVTDTAWTPETPLPRGGLFTWDVLVEAKEGTAIIPNGEKPRPAFRILSDDEYRRYQDQNHQLSNSHLVLGTYFLNLGLLDEAKSHFEQLLQGNPNSDVPKRMLQNLKELRE